MRKPLLVCILLSLGCLQSRAQYWQQRVDYTIDVALDDHQHSLDGFERMEYTNNSPDTLHFIWIHLWPNAYKNDRTAYTDQALENGSTRFYFSSREERGYINRLDFKVNGNTATLEDHPQYIDIGKLILPAPLAPGQHITITTPFHLQLPFNFSRGGHDGESYQATQWYPKPAVYDKNGWHPMPYLDQGEFYSEFGSYDVSITLPDNYVVAATGELQNPSEKEWLKTRSNFTWEPIRGREKNAGGQFRTVYQLFPASSPTIKTLRYKQSNVHDFAWFADKRFIVQQDTCRLSSGKVIDVVAYYTPQGKGWQQSLAFAKDGVRFYSRMVGEYPYSIVQVVQGPKSFGGGMEYPTITVISPGSDPKTLDATIAHEIGHNWFYGILASNERAHPWMDEGINSYYEQLYSREKYGQTPALERIGFETKVATHTDQPIELSADRYTELNYALIAYYKTAEWLRYLELEIGTDAFNKAMQSYYQEWKFKHPQPDDFKNAIATSTGKNPDSIFSLLNKTGNLPHLQRKGTRLVTPFQMSGLVDYLKHPSKNLITISPVLGANSYDKLMLGVAATNIKLPPSAFQFLLAPMYAFGSKELNGIGFISYDFYPKQLFQSISIGNSFERFTMDEFSDGDKKVTMGFQKLVPGIKLTLREKDLRSQRKRFLQFRSYLIREEDLRFYRDTVITQPGPDTTVFNRFRTISEDRVLNQLRFVIENDRVLYPYRGELKLEQGESFLRAGFTGNYFFNYPKGGGLSVRLFAGKFFYTGSKTISRQFATDRYHLNMTGPNGYEDYTYSDYFAGRNRFEGIWSQQIMNRDGAFKVRTDLLADKVGRTDDWLAAANFSTSIPSAINPLSLLPVKIPLHLFADIGTYAEAWKQDASVDRFLFDAGIHIPLFRETINIYIPLVYSNVYSDYYKSTIPKKERFWKKISFTIDIADFNFRKIDRNLSF